MRAKPGACVCRILGDNLVRTGATVCFEKGGCSNARNALPTPSMPALI